MKKRRCFNRFAILQHSKLGTAALYRALFGFRTYAAYNLANLANLRGWPLAMVVVDIFWGGLQTAATSVTGFFLSARL